MNTDILELREALRRWDGSSMRAGMQTLLVRESERVRAQVHQIEITRQEALRNASAPAIEPVGCLLRLKGIGVNSAWGSVLEVCAWRVFRHRGELGRLSGLAPTPYASSERAKACGISKAGHRPVRAMAIEIAWSWLRNQPDSQLSRWYRQRLAKGSRRVRRLGIAALARKLWITLWRHVEDGVWPAGAQLKPA